MSNISKPFDGREFRKATASSNGGGCVYLPSRLDAVADSKSGAVLRVPGSGLVAWAKETR